MKVKIKLTPKAIKIGSTCCTVIGALTTVIASAFEDKKMKMDIAEEVTKQLAETVNKL